MSPSANSVSPDWVKSDESATRLTLCASVALDTEALLEGISPRFFSSGSSGQHLLPLVKRASTPRSISHLTCVQPEVCLFLLGKQTRNFPLAIKQPLADFCQRNLFSVQ